MCFIGMWICIANIVFQIKLILNLFNHFPWQFLYAPSFTFLYEIISKPHSFLYVFHQYGKYYFSFFISQLKKVVSLQRNLNR